MSSPSPNKASLTQKTTGNNSHSSNKVLGASVGHPGGVKDPYEYVRRHSYPEPPVQESEEWYSYWVEDELDEDGEDEEVVVVKPLEGGKNSKELLNPSNRSRRANGLHVRQQEAEELNENQSARKSILDVDPSVDPYLLNGVASEDDEAGHDTGEDDEDEVVDHNERDEEDAIESTDSFDDDEDGKDDFNEDKGAAEQKEVDQDQGFCNGGQENTGVTGTPSCSYQSSAKESAAVNSATEIESGTDAPLEENPSSGKGTTSSVSERRTRSSPGGRKFHKSSNYLRRRARVQIDDVILEEDEEAIEAANIQVISESSPNLVVRSILKRQESSVSDKDVLMGNVPPNGQGHALKASEQAQSFKTGRAVHFSLHDHIIQEGEVWQSSHGTGPATTQPNSLSSDDEWMDYDKVIVSHNLAEEILDEIYGKLEPIASTRKKEESQSENLSNSHEMPVKCANEDVHVSSSEESSNYSEDFQQMSEQFKKSLADEILDELYGHTPVGKSHYETVPSVSPEEETRTKSNSNPSSLLSSPDLSSSSFRRAQYQSGASPRASIRSKDDLDLPDPKAVVGE